MNQKILLIDDDLLVLASFERLLKSEGYEVISASNYNEAIKRIQNGEFDLVLSDIRMPGKNGVEMVQDIQQRLTEAGKNDLPIIFITGYAEMSDLLNANFHGEVLNKPIDNELLLATIREYL